MAERRKRGVLSDERTGPWFLALIPALLALLAAFGLPIVELFSASLHKMAGPAQIGDAFTLDNYADVFRDSLFAEVLARTVGLGLVVVIFCLLIGYPVSYLLARTNAKWRDFAFFLVTASLLVSSVVRNLGWFPILGESGMLNWLLIHAGLLRTPASMVGNVAGVVIGLVHAELPIAILVLTTVIRRIEPELEEAARSLGAPPLETFWRVVLPLSLPGIVSGSLLIFTLAISAFTTPAILGGNRVLIMAIYVAQQFQIVLDYPAGATAAVLLLVTAALLTWAATLLRMRGGDQA
jgi:putative spermidine/putrescine transport system permease protein